MAFHGCCKSKRRAWYGSRKSRHPNNCCCYFCYWLVETLMANPLCKTCVVLAPACSLGYNQHSTPCRLSPVSPGLFHLAPVSPSPRFWSCHRLFPERDTPFHAFIFFVLLFQAKYCFTPRNQLRDSILSVPPLGFHSPSPQAGINSSTS